MTKRVILLVEGNPDAVALTLRALEKNNIMDEVVVARDGAQALDYLFEGGAHAGRDVTELLTLLDLKLPKVSRLEVLERLRSDERIRLAPVVILTSSKEDRDLIEAYGVAVRQLGLYWRVLKPSLPPRVPR